MNSILALVYGQTGIGKTTLAVSAPSPIVFDFDAGEQRVKPMHSIGSDYVANPTYRDVVGFLESNQVEMYETIVVDTLSKFIDSMVKHISRTFPKAMNNDGSPNRSGWAILKTLFSDFINLIQRLGKHIIFIDHAKTKEDNGTVKYLPFSSDTRVTELSSILNLIGYVRAVGSHRTISFNATESYECKNSWDLESEYAIPNADNGNVFLTDLFTEIHAKSKAMRSEADSILETINELKGDIALLKTVEDVNKFMQNMNGEASLPIKKKIWSELRKHAVSLGFDFNQEEKVWFSK